MNQNQTVNLHTIKARRVQETLPNILPSRDLLIRSRRFYCGCLFEMNQLDLCDQHVTLLHEYYFKVPPSPRLVGIELNPGPPRKAENVNTALAKLLNKLAVNKRRKDRKVPRKSKATSYNNRGMITLAGPPTSVGVTTRMSKPKPFSLPFTNTLLTATSGSSGNVLFNNGTQSGGQIAITMASTNIVGGVWQCFTNSILNLAKTFIRYRFKSLIVRYNPLVSTSTGGGITLCCIDDASATGATSNAYADVASAAGAVSGPIWGPLALNCDGFYNKGWLYTDISGSTAVVNESEERFLGACTLCISSQAVASSFTVGTITLEGEIEFKDIAITTLV